MTCSSSMAKEVLVQYPTSMSPYFLSVITARTSVFVRTFSVTNQSDLSSTMTSCDSRSRQLPDDEFALIASYAQASQLQNFESPAQLSEYTRTSRCPSTTTLRVFY
eukprot:Blabericola_migrator_1__7881@NODE_402_length_8862_cov_53_826265_g319_i0_p9_GENE_NODE_402_length_8862_cov_53_826265_g319_i0NODE_402_length_8862_cov_53_826265_g319_i0_p9_ORF_typecomplete_len106_score4_67_NODE_402_length_8862_cov_53_826265_g319_i077848101